MHIRLVAQGVDLGPEYRYTTADLNKAELNTVVIGTDEQDLLGLVEVGDVSVFVDPAPEVARSRPVTRPPTDEAKAYMVAVDTFRSNVEC